MYSICYSPNAHSTSSRTGGNRSRTGSVRACMAVRVRINTHTGSQQRGFFSGLGVCLQFANCLQTPVCLCLFHCLCLFAKNPAPAGVCKQCLFANCLQTELLANGCRILLLGMKVLFFPVDIVLFLGMKVLFFPVAQLAASQVDPRCLRRPPGPPSVTHNLPRNHVCVRAALGKFWLVFVLCFCVCKQCLFANCLQTVCLRKIRLRRVFANSACLQTVCKLFVCEKSGSGGCLQTVPVCKLFAN